MNISVNISVCFVCNTFGNLFVICQCIAMAEAKSNSSYNLIFFISSGLNMII